MIGTPPTPPRPSVTAVNGILVGHYTDLLGGTGCTVVLAPPGGMRAAVTLRGRATGTRELDALSPRHVVGHVDAILLTGGSAYGLGAADGVMQWLRQRGRGYPVGAHGVVPIVPAAVVFDLGNVGTTVRWPGPNEAAQACDAAGTDVAEGSVGAGTGATVGKIQGFAGAMKGGLGTWAVRAGDVIVGALVVVNAVGDVRDAAGAILAGGRGPDGRFVDAVRYLAEGNPPFGGAEGTTHTTLAVVATNAALTRVELEALAQVGSDALARRIAPYGTLFDGDVVFAVSTAQLPPASPLQVEALATLAVPEAVERAVRLARGTPKVPGVADLAR
ncbi:MAG TPA: P1 family peptidase [Gemmatimonadales bacterium]|nr:P1 family peptidase [Gemmatimonadales bacterium]